jgi:hypothetical protein
MKDRCMESHFVSRLVSFTLDLPFADVFSDSELLLYRFFVLAFGV